MGKYLTTSVSQELYPMMSPSEENASCTAVMNWIYQEAQVNETALLHYLLVTEFLLINGGEQSFLTRRHNAGADSEVLYQLSWNFVGNSSWIVSALGLVETFAFTLEPISVLRNEYDEQAQIRVVNLMAGASRVSVTSDTGLALADGLGWIGVQDSLIPAGSYSLQVSNDAGADESLSFDFEANFTYTLYVVGQETLEVLNIVSQADMTNVRFVNNSSSAVDIAYCHNLLFALGCGENYHPKQACNPDCQRKNTNHAMSYTLIILFKQILLGRRQLCESGFRTVFVGRHIRVVAGK